MVQLIGEPFVQVYSEVHPETKKAGIDDKNKRVDLNDV